MGLLGLLLLHPDYIAPVAAMLPPEELVTAFSRGVYQTLLERQKSGLLVEIGFLSGIYDDDDMGYISRMVKDARERRQSLEEAKQYAEVIRAENRLKALKHPESLPEDSIKDVLTALRREKK